MRSISLLLLCVLAYSFSYQTPGDQYKNLMMRKQMVTFSSHKEHKGPSQLIISPPYRNKHTTFRLQTTQLYSSSPPPASEQPQQVKPKRGKPCVRPVTSLAGYRGLLDSARNSNQIVVTKFFASWCRSCKSIQGR